jgi:hypothetical protein
VSIQDLQQNPQDTSNFYLANIYQALADPNRSIIPGSPPTSPPPFSAPTYAVWVNSLWFLSLVTSITCALLATLLQQWARRYLKATQPRYSLHKRARHRSFFSEGVEKSLLPLAVEALPTLLHLSVFFFFAGLVVFLRNVNLTIFKVVLSWISVCTALYGCITLIPVFRRDSPYYTPLTPLARFVVAVIYFVIYVLCLCVSGSVFFCSLSCSLCFDCLGPFRMVLSLSDWFAHAWERTFRTPEEAILRSPLEIDNRAFMWTFDRLDEDHELESFFSGLPGFHSSKVLSKPLSGLNSDQRLKLLVAMIRLWDRTFSYDLLPGQVKRQRAEICVSAIDLVYRPEGFPEIVRTFASEDEYGPVNSTEIVRFIKRWDNYKGEDTTVVKAMYSVVVARVQRHDDSWFVLASSELGRSEAVLREHAAHGDSLSLAILIHITRQQFIHFGNTSWPSDAISDVLEVASKFNAQDTTPELQHEFCALWNEIVRKAQEDTKWKIVYGISRRIRSVYLTLHHDTNSAPTRFDAFTSGQDDVMRLLVSYPMCNVAGHIHEDSSSSSSTSFSHNIHDNNAQSPASFPVTAAPFHVDESATTVPPLDNLNPTHHSIESFRVAVTSLDQPTAAIQDILAPGLTMPNPTSEAYTPAHPHFSTSPPAAVSLQRNEGPWTPPDSLNLPSLASNPTLGNISSTGPSLSTLSPVTLT